ncbi:MAG: hypothetical protein SWH68_10380 [Thermodesulfobacteriota bacterium]|nr:hypothetical protein [Thermodesulfobacteriota bacterium]
MIDLNNSIKPYYFKRLSFAGIVMAVLFCLVWPAGAEQAAPDKAGEKQKTDKRSVQALPPGAGSNTQAQQQVRQTLMRMQTLQQELQKIQKEVVAENPELKKAQDEFRALLNKTFKEKLDEADVDMARLKELQAKLQKDQKAGELSEKQKKALQQEFRTKAAKFKKARQQALSEQSVQEKRAILAADMKAAMVEASPKAEKIINELESLQAGMRQMQQ